MPEGDAKGASGVAAPAKHASRSKKAPDEGKPKQRSDAGGAGSAARRQDEGRATAPGKTASIAGELHCPNGVLEDPHRGFVRCLAADERGAKWLPPAPQEDPRVGDVSAPAAPSTVASAPSAPSAPAAAPNSPPFVAPPASSASTTPPAPAATAPASTAPPIVEIKAPEFENGDVPRAEKALNKLTDDIGKCVAKNGGMSRATASMKIQFIVRAKGRAEGVEILSSQGVSAEASSCIRVLLKNKSVGQPSSDPVGATVVITLKAAGR